MNFNFVAVLAALGANFAFRIMNAARPPADYLFNTFLPELPKPTYVAKSGNMTVRPTMAGLVGMDSPYPPSGIVTASTFVEQIAKLANRVTLTEEAQRELQQLVLLAGSNATASNEVVRNTVLNFTDKLLVQSHLDAMEWLRGRALVAGEIDWTFNKINLTVDYGVPLGNFSTHRTGNDGYGGSTSKFWTDMRSMNSKLKHQVRARIAHPDTIDMIVSNEANDARIIAQDDVTGTMTIGRLVGDNKELSSDARDRFTLVAYGAEGEVIDPDDPTTTRLVPFLETGKIIGIGKSVPRGFQVGQGATPDPTNDLSIGYTHIGPTVEGGGQPGRWSDVRVPDGQPWQLEGRGVTNGLPVIEDPNKLAVASTVMV